MIAKSNVTLFPAPELGLFNEEVNTNANARLGIAIEQSANVLTGVRAIGGIALGTYIRNSPAYQSWETFGTFAVLALTDGEGCLSRLGRRFQGKDELHNRPLNAYADHLADKTLIDLTMEAIAAREGANGDITYARMTKAASSVIITRDVITTADRFVADIQGIDTRAQKDGKLKALKQYLVTGFALSPLAKNSIVKKGVGLAFLYTAKESVRSGLSLHNSFSEQRRVQKLKLQATTTDCPDFVEQPDPKMPLVDTIPATS